MKVMLSNLRAEIISWPKRGTVKAVVGSLNQGKEGEEGVLIVVIVILKIKSEELFCM